MRFSPSAPSIRHLSSVIRIRHEFQERAVGIAEIDAGALPFGANALHGSELDRHLVAGQMRDGIGDRAFPLEADVAVAWLHRHARRDHTAHAGSGKIWLGIAEPRGKKLPTRYPS